jgi:FAD/FMN-containing dehydrogenase
MIARRQFLAGLGAVTVVGFNPRTRSWIATAEAASPFDHVPALDGAIVMDPSSLAADAIDVGNIVHNAPIAILRPGSVADIQKMVRFCLLHGIKVAARGQAHTTFGQSMTRGGLAIEMTFLDTVHEITSTYANVDAGYQWKTLLETVVPMGLTPPALTGFTGLTFGGTLSVGGISANYANGAQVDFVREIDIVTGDGELKTCSLQQNPALFEAALAGLGQCGIMTRMVVDLVPAKPFVRLMTVTYTDSSKFFRDFRTLINRNELDEVFNIGVPNSSNGWDYGLNTAIYFDPASPPDVAHLLRGLTIDPASVTVTDIPYLAYLLRVDNLVDVFRAAGLWDGVLHPWFDIFLPDATVEEYVSDVTSKLTFDDVGTAGFLLLFAKRASNFKRPLLRVPRENEYFYLFDILTANSHAGPDPAFQARMLARNRSLFERARRAGGYRYPIGAVQFNELDWIQHYGELFPAFLAAKRIFDPGNILTPGPGIFGS